MITYPLSPVEKTVVLWSGRVITLLALTAFVLFGAMAMASS